MNRESGIEHKQGKKGIWAENFAQAVGIIKQHRMRSALLILGVAIGITTILMMVTVLSGLSRKINKDLVAASATPLVLAILAERESYGYAILKRVSDLSGGNLEWSDGMLYPVLHRLERLGHIAGRWKKSENGRRRRYYRITPRGREQLAAECRQWQAVDAALRNVWSLLTVRTGLKPLEGR